MAQTTRSTSSDVPLNVFVTGPSGLGAKTRGGAAPLATGYQLGVIDGGSSSGIAGIYSITPADGSEINVNPTIARFTPIVGIVDIHANEVPLAYVVIGSLWWLIYDGTQFSPFFAERSTLTSVSRRYTFSVLPNGGWWRSSLRLEFVSGKVLVQE